MTLAQSVRLHKKLAKAKKQKDKKEMERLEAEIHEAFYALHRNPHP